MSAVKLLMAVRRRMFTLIKPSWVGRLWKLSACTEVENGEPMTVLISRESKAKVTDWQIQEEYPTPELVEVSGVKRTFCQREFVVS